MNDCSYLIIWQSRYVGKLVLWLLSSKRYLFLFHILTKMEKNLCKNMICKIEPPLQNRYRHKHLICITPEKFGELKHKLILPSSLMLLNYFAYQTKTRETIRDLFGKAWIILYSKICNYNSDHFPHQFRMQVVRKILARQCNCIDGSLSQDHPAGRLHSLVSVGFDLQNSILLAQAGDNGLTIQGSYAPREHIVCPTCSKQTYDGSISTLVPHVGNSEDICSAIQEYG